MDGLTRQTETYIAYYSPTQATNLKDLPVYEDPATGKAFFATEIVRAGDGPTHPDAFLLCASQEPPKCLGDSSGIVTIYGSAWEGRQGNHGQGSALRQARGGEEAILKAALNPKTAFSPNRPVQLLTSGSRRPHGARSALVVS
jgi:hypothetical protein